MSKHDANLIVVAGCGWVTPFAAGTIAEVLATARSLSGPPESYRGYTTGTLGWTSSSSAAPTEGGYWAVPEDLPKAYPMLSAEIQQDKGAWIAAIALEHARRQAVPPKSMPAERVGMVLGCALAGQLGMITFANEVRAQSARFVSPIHFPQTVGNYVAGALARAYSIRGPNSTIAAGPASGLDAIAQATALLASGAADVVYAGGIDALSRDLALGLASPDTLLSDGACLFVLERQSEAIAWGHAPLAAVLDCHRFPAGEPPPPYPADTLVVSAGLDHRGAVRIEERVGSCFAALGAGAAAWAIGRGQATGVAMAVGDGAHTTIIEFSIGSCSP